MPYEERTLAIDFDLIDHELVIADSDGRRRALPLVARPVCDFYRELVAVLDALDFRVQVSTRPVECPVTTPFDVDREHAAYDPEHARRFGQILRHIEPVFEVFRAGFRGKCSPVHFFWGSFDLAVSRFSGRRTPARAGSVIERDAYDEEVISLGFWPGDPWTRGTDATFYSYTVPEPAAFRSQRVRPDSAFYSDGLKEFLLPYDEVRRASDPGRAILDFARSTYDAGSTLAGWPRDALAYP
jgi:hypothetical protein